MTVMPSRSPQRLPHSVKHSFSEKQPKCKLRVSKYEMVQNHSMFVQNETSVPGV